MGRGAMIARLVVPNVVPTPHSDEGTGHVPLGAAPQGVRRSIMCCLLLVSALAPAVVAEAEPARLVCPAFLVEIDPRLGAWSLVDAKSGVRWPTVGTAGAGKADGLEGAFDKVTSSARSV